MAAVFDGAIQRLIDAFAALPGIGPKGAQRIAFYLLAEEKEDQAQELIESIALVRDTIRFCDVCGNVCQASPCPICADPRRDHSIICVVQEPKDIMSIERTHEYRGVYHVLGGAINPMSGISPQQLTIKELLERLKDATVSEVILALDPNIEGETTASYIARLLDALQVRVTKLASGLPMGGDLEYADEVTLARALAGRREM